MTVRAWITISVLVLVALIAAAAVKILSPIRAPEILASAGRVRLEGVPDGSCWPQRSGEPRCERERASPRPGGKAVPSRGTVRFIVVWPAQPDGGRLEIVRNGDVLRTEPWSDRLDYDLVRGDYLLRAEARYGADAYVRATFGFTVP